MTALAAVPVRRITAAIASAAQRWADADFPPRVRILDRIVQRTGYSVPVVEYALDRLFTSITQDALEATIADELGSIDVLDQFVSRDSASQRRAQPAGHVAIISSRTTIGVALIPALFALCAKCDVVVKDREDALIGAFFRTLCEEGDEFRAAAGATAWKSSDESAPALNAFDVVVAFGTDGTLNEIAKRVGGDSRFIGFGSRASVGYVTRESLRDEATAKTIARGAARDLVLYESEGCLSLHVLFAERGAAVSLDDFGALLANEVRSATIEFPLGRRDAAAVARLAHERDLATFRAASGVGRVFASDTADYAVFVDESPTPPRFLPRALGIIAVDRPAQACDYITRHQLPIEGFALSCDRSDVIDAALSAGAVRIARFGELQHPPLRGHHGGRARIADFIRWIDKTL